MPTSLLEELSNDKLKAVLIHELVHIKRFDLWINFAQTFLQIIYFYNPFVWLANAVVRRLREQAVDETVLVAMGTEAKSYSNTLIDIAEMAFFKTNFGLRLIGVAESKKSLHRRIKHMLSRPIPKSAKIGVLSLITLIALAAVLLPMAGRIRGAAIGESSVQDDSDTQLMLAW
jgi:beta-lactamase regulating signal transducer with metallopeptidase domain